MELYQSNLKVAQAFHPLIGSLEVIIRNSIHHQLSSFFSDSDWIINQKSGFMSHSSLTYTCKKTGKTITNSYFLKSVTEAEQKLTKKGINITSSKIISEQTFGFWTDFFESHHYKILRGRPIKIFKYLPREYGRTEILNELNRVRQFRNRINHNEPICFTGSAIDFTNAIAVYASISSLITWLDSELATWIGNFDDIKQTIAKAQTI